MRRQPNDETEDGNAAQPAELFLYEGVLYDEVMLVLPGHKGAFAMQVMRGHATACMHDDNGTHLVFRTYAATAAQVAISQTEPPLQEVKHLLHMHTRHALRYTQHLQQRRQLHTHNHRLLVQARPAFEVSIATAHHMHCGG